MGIHAEVIINWELIGFAEGCLWLKTTLVLGTGYAIAKPAPARANVLIWYYAN